MQSAETVLGVLRDRHERGIGHWRATYSETGPRGSEEGRTEKEFPQGNHLAVRPILSPVVGIRLLGASDLEDGGATRGEDGLGLVGYAR
jgi:hypothetical protein